MGRQDAPELCRRLAQLIVAVRPAVVVCDVAALTHPDFGVLDVLARLRLTALRHGCDLVLDEPGEKLRTLISFSGLDEVLPLMPGHDSGVDR